MSTLSMILQHHVRYFTCSTLSLLVRPHCDYASVVCMVFSHAWWKTKLHYKTCYIMATRCWDSSYHNLLDLPSLERWKLETMQTLSFKHVTLKISCSRALTHLASYNFILDHSLIFHHITLFWITFLLKLTFLLFHTRYLFGLI